MSMSGSQRVMLIALLAISSVVLGAQEQGAASATELEARTATSVETPEQYWTPCNVGGIYRPFSLARRLKLATAYCRATI